jgi:molybdopterin-guanine dinucleotide biosynthesis protein
MLLEHLPGWAAVKVTRCHAGRSCPHEKACGVCSSLDRPWSLREMPPDDSPQKDTGRLRAAGASRVLWLVTTEDAAREGLAEALLRLREVPGVVIEGNAAASLPSLAMLIAVRRAGQANPSPRRAAAMAAADMTINITGPGTPPTLRETCQRIADRLRRGESAPAAHSPSA